MGTEQKPIITQLHTLNIQPPEEFSFKASDWEKYLTRFSRFRVVSELDKKSEELQVSTLLYMMGPGAEDLTKSLNLSTAHLKSYKAVTEKITMFYEPRNNILFSRAQFNTRTQKPGESTEAFVAACSALVTKCNYGSLQDELLRDRLIVGTLNKKLSEKLQLMEDVTLEKTIDNLIQSDIVHKQQKLLHAETKGELNYVQKPKTHKSSKSSKTPKSKTQKNSQNSQKPNEAQKSNNKCTKCGQSHDKGNCPAKDKTCYRCRGFSHFPVKPNFPHCQTLDSPKNMGFLGSMDAHKSDPWIVDVLVNETLVSFAADSGACLTAVPLSLYDSNFGELHFVSNTVKGPDGKNLPVKGYFDANLRRLDCSVDTKVYVIEGLVRPLLGRAVLETLKVINFLANVDNSVEWEKL